MSVFSKIGGFLNRHRNKFFIGGVVLSGSLLLTRYAQHRLQQWQQNEVKEFFERSRKRQNFETTERTCNQVVFSLMSALNDSLSNIINTEDIIKELRGNPENKVELWDELKVLVFNKVSCLIYVCTMLVVLLRVQMNILAGHLYKYSEEHGEIELQKQYLSLCHNLLENGAQNISKTLQKEYKKILDIIPLKRQLKINDLEKIFWTAQMELRESPEDPIKNFKQLVINETTLTDEPTTFSGLVQDTGDLLSSEEVREITSSCISRGFALLGDQIAEFYAPGTSATFVHPSDTKMALAKLIPIINGLVSKNALPELLIKQLTANDKLKMLGANVYEAFSYNNNNNI